MSASEMFKQEISLALVGAQDLEEERYMPFFSLVTVKRRLKAFRGT